VSGCTTAFYKPILVSDFLNDASTFRDPKARLAQLTAAILTAVQRAKFLPAEQQLKVGTVLSEAYSVQMKILVGFAAAQVLVVGLVHSLCVVWKENGFTQYWANIAMKINLKAGGTNHTTDGVEQIL
jgi:hypothetical protein